MYRGEPVPPATRKTRSHTLSDSMQSKTDDVLTVPNTKAIAPAHLTVNEKGGRSRARGSGRGGDQPRRGSGQRECGGDKSGRGRGPGRVRKNPRGRPRKVHSSNGDDASGSDESIVSLCL